MKSKIQPDRIEEYWDQCTDLYLKHMTTFQAGLFASPNSSDPFRENALEICKRSDIQSGHRILDLGCGVCGPVAEIAKHHANISFVCVTNCERQVEHAEKRIHSLGLQDQIEILFLDYHDIAGLPGKFDRCLFLESFGYTLVPEQLLKSVFDKLHSGGRLYIKDVCRRWNLSDTDMVELEEFNETYCYNTPLLRDVRKNAELIGFSVENGEIVTSEMYRAHSRASMFVDPDNSNELTEFGRRHFKGFANLPIEFYELNAVKLT